MMGHDEPFAYVIPFMPDTSQFIRLTGNMPLDPNMPLGRKALSMIRAHTGTIRSLAVVELDEENRARLARFGLALTPGSECERFRSRLDTFTTCALTKNHQEDISNDESYCAMATHRRFNVSRRFPTT